MHERIVTIVLQMRSGHINDLAFAVKHANSNLSSFRRWWGGSSICRWWELRRVKRYTTTCRLRSKHIVERWVNYFLEWDGFAGISQHLLPFYKRSIRSTALRSHYQWHQGTQLLVLRYQYLERSTNLWLLDSTPFFWSQPRIYHSRSWLLVKYFPHCTRERQIT